ncbi:MAG: patatin-like phospholipase family protein [Rhodospirillales bacterium]|nr:patatin-like phospholipase family protein [Rhodospirillales bacterium]
MTSRDEHLFGPGPKRMLALEGGGVRGIVALAFLERIEAMLAERSGLGSRFRLCDYFDMIGGTSTGSLIAAGLALGFSVGQLVDIYLNLAHRGFRGARWHGGVLIPKFRTEPFVAVLREQIGDATLGSERLRTGLAIVAKRIDTGSVWVFHNNPRGVYFGPAAHDDGAAPNRDLPLVNLVRASTAAPTFFAPETIEIARGVKGVFVDGGASPHNNPSLLLLMLAALEGYGYRWPLGAENLLLCSVGTGEQPVARSAQEFARMSGASLAVQSLMSMMNDCNWLNQTLLQWLSECPTPWTIDSEIGDLAADRLAGGPLLRYLRYDVGLSRAWLERELSMILSDRELADLACIDRPELASRLLGLGRAAALPQISETHFSERFDPPPAGAVA